MAVEWQVDIMSTFMKQGPDAWPDSALKRNSQKQVRICFVHRVTWIQLKIDEWQASASTLKA